jgi:hypothetical protein
MAGLPALGMTRQALHAARLSFVHPIHGRKRLRFEAPLPDDMAQAWALAGGLCARGCTKCGFWCIMRVQMQGEKP